MHHLPYSAVPKPVAPELQSAPTSSELASMQQRSRCIAVLLALGGIRVASTIAVFIFCSFRDILHHVNDPDIGAHMFGVAAVIVLGIAVCVTPAVFVSALWSTHSPAQRWDLEAINDLRDNTYMAKRCPGFLDHIELYRSEVLVMKRAFTPFDRRVLLDFKDKMSEHQFRVEEWERDLKQKERLHDDRASAAAAASVIARVKIV